MKTRRKIIEEFRVIDDEGKVYKVLKRQVMIEAPRGVTVLNHGNIDFILSDGRGVSPIGVGDREFKIVASDKIIRKC